MKQGFVVIIRILFILYISSVCCLCFLNFSFQEDIDIPTYLWGIRIDRVVHFLMFLPYAILAIPVFNLSRRNTSLKTVRCIIITLTGIIFAAGTELIQKYFLITREGDVIDFKADILGLLTGIAIFFIIYPLLTRRMKNVDTLL